jgi:hypothetical protein
MFVTLAVHCRLKNLLAGNQTPLLSFLRATGNLFFVASPRASF